MPGESRKSMLKLGALPIAGKCRTPSWMRLMRKRATFWENHLACQPHGTLVVESEKAIIGFCDLVPSRDKDSKSP